MPENIGENHLKIAIVSDIHACIDGEYSWLDMSRPDTIRHNPFQAVKNLFDQEQLSVDVLVCSGDLGTQGDFKTIEYCWKQLNELKEYISASELVVVPGNHDHDSRFAKQYDPKYFLQQLSPSFPTPDFNLNTHFWAWHWVHYETSLADFIILNSSAFHGMKNQETEHGRISDLTIDRIESKLSECTKNFKIVVVHHHPVKQDIDGEDYEAIKDGDKLINLLSKAEAGHWLIIHGHRHYPNVFYGPGSNSPTIFSAASLAAKLDGTYQVESANQFHLITLDYQQTQKHGQVSGLFNTWEWSVNKWIETNGMDRGLPAKGGFGFRSNSAQTSRIISEALGSEPHLKGDDIYKKLPQLKFCIPEELAHLKCTLENEGIVMTLLNGAITEIGKKANQ